MQTTHKKIQQTKQSLFDALFQLVNSKRIEEITVTQLCKEARINRTTFYKYYSVPLDVINEYMDDFCSESFSAITTSNGLDHSDSILTLMTKLCKIYYNNKRIIKLYTNFNAEFMTILQKAINKNVELNYGEHYLESFISGGVAAIVIQWSLSDFKQEPEDVAIILAEYM